MKDFELDKLKRKKRLETLYEEQSQLIPGLNLTDFNPEINVEFNRPLFDTNYSIQSEINNKIENLTTNDSSIFAKWQIADLPVMFVAGGLGTLTSYVLRDFFADLHDNKWGRKTTDKGGHSRENIDKVPGAKQAGGFGHRWKYGHDIFNPFEVDWEQYINIAKQSGKKLPPWLEAIFYWLRHLLQDTFSKEGLPIPGHSLLRKILDFNDPKTREILQFLATIKMRDITGAAATNLIMGSYLWGTEKSIKRVVTTPNYRAFSLMLGANLVTLLSGLLIPPPSTSFNWGTIPAIAYYSIQLIRLEKRVRISLNNNDSKLFSNDKILSENENIISELSIFNNKEFDKLITYESEINEFYSKVELKHEYVKSLIGDSNYANTDFSSC